MHLSGKEVTLLMAEKIHNPQLTAFKTLAQSYSLFTSN
jgi:hypothetical protein